MSITNAPELVVKEYESIRTNDTYYISETDNKHFKCSCPGFKHRHNCKHIKDFFEQHFYGFYHNNMDKRNASFLIGDKVCIVNKGKCYPSYDSWAEEQELNNYISDAEPCYGMIGKITHIRRHGKQNGLVLANIRVNEQDFIMGFEGINKLERESASRLLNIDFNWTRAELESYLKERNKK